MVRRKPKPCCCLAASHRKVGRVGAPDTVRPIDRQPALRVWRKPLNDDIDGPAIADIYERLLP